MTSAATVSGVLLAAGGGSRLGQPKALVDFQGRLLVERGVAVLLDGGCDDVVVVLGAQAEQVTARADLSPARVVVNGRWRSGLASSLVAGLRAAGVPCGAAVVALADQPLIGAGAVQRLRTAWEGGAIAAVATYQGRPRNPVLFDRSVFDEVAASARGDQGAQPWLRAHPHLVTPVACDDTGTPDDVDTAADLAALRPLTPH